MPVPCLWVWYSYLKNSSSKEIEKIFEGVIASRACALLLFFKRRALNTFVLLEKLYSMRVVAVYGNQNYPPIVYKTTPLSSTKLPPYRLQNYPLIVYKTTPIGQRKYPLLSMQLSIIVYKIKNYFSMIVYKLILTLCAILIQSNSWIKSQKKKILI
jgi:hypothetical protein